MQSVYGSLDPGQDPRQFAQSLQNVLQQLEEVKRQREELYNQQFGGQGGGQRQPAAPRMTGRGGSRIIAVE